MSRAERTLQELHQRVRAMGDLPGFSTALGAIREALADGDERDVNPTRLVLSEPALTQRVLRLANSAMYAAFDRSVDTVTGAVMVLGTDAIDNLALGIKFIEELGAAAPSASATRAEMEKAIVAGHVAREIATPIASPRDAEAAVVCSMLHALGPTAVAYYLPQQWHAIRSSAAQTGSTLNEAAVAHLGLGLDAVGQVLAEKWKLPRRLVRHMRNSAPAGARLSLEHEDWLATLSTLAAACADTLVDTGAVLDPGAAGGAVLARLGKLADAYMPMLGLEPRQLGSALTAARTALASDRSLSAPGAPARAGASPSSDAASQLLEGIAGLHAAGATSAVEPLVGIALEVLHRALRLNRAVAFMHQPSRNRYVATLALGKKPSTELARLAFDDAFRPDVFHVALANRRIVVVNDAKDPHFADKLPSWWRDALWSAAGFVILPIVVDRRAVGLLYGDWARREAAPEFEGSVIAALAALRAALDEEIARPRAATPPATPARPHAPRQG